MSLKIKQASTLFWPQSQRLNAELHAKIAAVIEECLADPCGCLQLLHDVHSDQVTAEAFCVGRVQVFLEKHVQVPLLKLLKPTLGPKKRFKIFQCGIGGSAYEGIASGQSLLEKTVHLRMPASLKLVQRFDDKHLSGLLGDGHDLLAKRIWQAGSDSQ